MSRTLQAILLEQLALNTTTCMFVPAERYTAVFYTDITKTTDLVCVRALTAREE